MNLFQIHFIYFNSIWSLKIFRLPAGTTPVLQPADVYFNRPFKDFIRHICQKIRWRHNDFVLSVRDNFLKILDLVWNQCKAPRFRECIKYSWYRAGYLKKHPPKYLTPYKYCMEFQGHIKCESDQCTEYCFLRCAHCELHFCFNHVKDHRHDIWNFKFLNRNK